MRVLAIDTAGVDCSVAVYDAARDRVLARVQETLGKGHAERLSGMIDEAFGQAGLTPSDIGRIGVTIGPGSFTGIRVGVAAARGLVLALGVPAVGVTTLDVLAETARRGGLQGALIAAIDAKRDEIYLQSFDESGIAVSAPEALSVEDARARLSGLKVPVVGSGAAVLAGTPAAPDHFDIDAVARITSRISNVTGKPAPLYLRGPDAKPQAGFAIERRA
jgi:N6-L-threonylcarbamoyladenine synthase